MRLHDEAAAHANRKITALRNADRGLCARDAMARLGFKVAGDVSWDAVYIAVAREFLDAYYRAQGMPGTGMPKRQTSPDVQAGLPPPQMPAQRKVVALRR